MPGPIIARRSPGSETALTSIGAARLVGEDRQSHQRDPSRSIGRGEYPAHVGPDEGAGVLIAAI